MATLFTISAAIAAPLMFAQPSSAAQPSPSHRYYIESGNSGLCLTNPAPAGVQTAQQLVLEPCNFNNTLDQQWYFPPFPLNNIYYIENLQNPGWCMDAETNTNFGVVDTWPCNGISNEDWNPGTFGQGPPFDNQNITSFIGGIGATHRCLDVSNGNVAPGGVVGLYRCFGGSDNNSQVWTTHPAP
jgi:hypothetical protein